MDPPQSWTTNANQAVSLVFHDAGKMGRGTDRVHPEFTYPIFGEEERIQGYDNPRVTVRTEERKGEEGAREPTNEVVGSGERE